MWKPLTYFLMIIMGGQLVLLNSCAKPPEYPIEPIISFKSISKDTMRRGAMQEDTTFVAFTFTDGDGDLGSKDSLDLFVTDTRTGVKESQLRIPFVPVLGASNGIKGEITFRLFSTCCIFPPDLGLDPCNGEHPSFRYDKVIYELFILDRAGHKSNVIQTEPVYIRCFK